MGNRTGRRGYRRAQPGDRRESTRYPLRQQVRYRTLAGGERAKSGGGETVDMSSGGILFTTDQPPSGQERLEVTVNWPVALEGRCPLKLVTVGRVVRTDGLRVAVRIDRYEFKTRGAEPPAPASVAAAERETT